MNSPTTCNTLVVKILSLIEDYDLKWGMDPRTCMLNFPTFQAMVDELTEAKIITNSYDKFRTVREGSFMFFGVQFLLCPHLPVPIDFSLPQGDHLCGYHR